jgi:uncharacterized membrane protein
VTAGSSAAGLAVAAGAAGFLAVAYLSSTGALPPLLAVSVALAPLLAGAVALSWRSRLRWPVTLAALALVGAALLFQARLSQHISALWFVQHAGGNGLLAIYFGRTLRPGEVPLVTRIAGAVLPSMSTAVVQYSRGVTMAWTVFFIAMMLLSIGLYFGSSTAVWSTFATLVSGPLVVLMFVLEFALRRRTLPADQCATIAQSVAGFRALVLEAGTRATPPSPHSNG